MDKVMFFSYMIAALTGVAIAFIELSSKFSDGIDRIISSIGSWVYVVVNAIAAIFFLYLAIVFDMKIADFKVQDHPYMGSFIIGLFSMGLLRSSIFTINLKGNNQNIGTIIQKILKWAEKQYDRDKTHFLLKEVPKIVKDIPFEAVEKYITPICLKAFSYPNEEDTNTILNLIKQFKSDGIDYPEETKVETLSIEVAKVVGVKILKQCKQNYDNNKDKRSVYEEKKERFMIILQEQGKKIRASMGVSQEDKE
jgi:hypothetical protein